MHVLVANLRDGNHDQAAMMKGVVPPALTSPRSRSRPESDQRNLPHQASPIRFSAAIWRSKQPAKASPDQRSKKTVAALVSLDHR